MEKIRQAIERAKSTRVPLTPELPENMDQPRPRAASPTVVQTFAKPAAAEIELNSNHLLSKRIVTYDASDPRSRPYDILRTQILQAMSRNSWKVIGVTSPTPGCGKTLTAANLAFSISRQSNQSVALVDLDLRKPQVAASFGVRPVGRGALDLLTQRLTLPEVCIPVRAAEQQLVILPTVSTTESSELIASSARNLLQNLKREFQTVILDLPPVLSGDEVMTLLPEIDCVLLVAAIGLSKLSEIEECMRHLHASQIVRLVANKTTDDTSATYYY